VFTSLYLLPFEIIPFQIHSTTKNDKGNVFSELHLLVNATDNEAVYKCEASNSALDIPLIAAVQMNVYCTCLTNLFNVSTVAIIAFTCCINSFSVPPEHIVIKKEPPEFRIGSVGRLICNVSSSNPEANLTFWRDGIEMENVIKQSKPGLHGGNATSIVVTLNVTADMDGNSFTCQAQNPKLGRHIHEDLRLEVMCTYLAEARNSCDVEDVN